MEICRVPSRSMDVEMLGLSVKGTMGSVPLGKAGLKRDV